MLVNYILHPQNYSLLDVIVFIISSFAVIFLTMPIHEFAHAWAANKLGDPTPRYYGRLSLNPFNHIDYMGALCIVLFGFGWAKPVSVNPRNFDNPKVGMAVTAFAGPLSNLLLAFIATFFSGAFIKLYFITNTLFFEYILLFFYWISYINVRLALFNLVPIPPLDGSRLLGVILPDRIYYKLMQYERYLYFIVLGLIFVGALDVPLTFLTERILSIFSSVPNLIFF